MNVEARKRSLRYFFAKIVEPLGYKFTPDDELADFLLEQETHLEEAHGSPFCPCQGRTQNHEENMKIVCPCIPFHRDHFDYMKRCWCGLFVHKDVADPDSLPQIPYADFRKAQDAGGSGEGR
jgi:ferredoxin-thioredoxin reductase catalytic subunit